MKRPAAVGEPHFHLHVRRLYHRAWLWGWKRKMRGKRERKKKIQYCRPVWAVDITCWAQNNEFLVSSEVLCCEEFPRGPSTPYINVYCFFQKKNKTPMTYTEILCPPESSFSNDTFKKKEGKRNYLLRCIRFFGWKWEKKMSSSKYTCHRQFVFCALLKLAQHRHTTENRHWMRWVLDHTAAFISFTVMTVS